MSGSSRLSIHFINSSISIDFNDETVSCFGLLVVLYGEGGARTCKIVHMGKRKSWSAAVKRGCNPL